ncbi:Aspartate aminotransferase, mitochondrial [Frankliniella fusca]|uniref:Aspartate aminotransferase, mitochondrial n=1 Tax=Frankliniella fusca TaxID=407009 RepID=A0AAE1I181_9NEOP|nr:Aspartate aminotransferase, mitochondrial [Frankliniella fusca]
MGRKCKIFEGYAFTQKKDREDTNVWTCSKKNCNGRIVFCNGTMTSSSPHISQCVPKSTREQQRNMLRHNAKRKATDDLSSRPLKIARQLLNVQGAQCSELCSKDLDLVRRSIHRERHKSWPEIPKSREELDKFLLAAFEEKSIKTSMGELFLYRSDSGMYMFTCETNLRMMSLCTSLMGDGTFDRAIQHSCQLYTIHGYKDGYHIPLAFFPLNGKSEEL